MLVLVAALQRAPYGFSAKGVNISCCDIFVGPPESHVMNKKKDLSPLAKKQYEALSEFRYQLRRFLRFSETAAKGEGITPLQYLMLLHVRGFPGRDWASIGELAERLQLQHHGVVALVSRGEEAGLVARRKSEADRRQMEVHLTARGERCLARLAALHEAELKSLRGIFQVARITAFNDDDSLH
jgi:DNA-binding MarR family transcriptional regulator